MNQEKQLSSDRELIDKNNEMIRERELFTNKEAAEFLRVSPVTLWRIREKGKIDFRIISAGKIVYTRADLETYLEKQKRAAFAQN